jgi:uncharacterized protein (DUF1697 family)
LNEPEVKQLYYTSLETTPEAIQIENLVSIQLLPDTFGIVNSTVYINYFKGYRSTKLTNDIFEKKLKIAATTRNAKRLIS